nr:choice-of-anchor D domain-containing protein [Bacteroidota bacterium]
MKKNLLLATLIIFAAINSFAQLQFFPDAVNFGQVTTGNTEIVELALTSDISQDITLTPLAAPFTIEPLSFFLHKDSTKILTVTFAPTDLGTYQQTVTATGTIYGSKTLTVTGEGIEADINVTPMIHDFGAISLINTISCYIKILNTGTGDLLCILSINNPVFTISANQMTVINGTADSVEVTFTPLNLPEETGILSIQSNDPDNPLVQVVLTGSGKNEISGPASGTWLKVNSPYYFVDNVYVPFEDTLTIEPGVEINMGDFYFNVYGKLVCNGLENDSIRFNGTDT